MVNSIVDSAFDYGERVFRKEQPFVPGVTPIPPSGKVIGGAEISNAVRAVLEGVLTEGPWVTVFERLLAATAGVRHASMCNSGSSANLLVLGALKSAKAPPELRLKPGDEIVTSAVGFPTTLNAILHNGLKPVFVDIELGTYVPSAEAILTALTHKTGAVFMAHTLGNPFPLDIEDELRGWGVTLVEDNCDALGSTYKGKMTGGFGIAATQSFYPAHHITSLDGNEDILLRSPTGDIAWQAIGPFVEGGDYTGWECVSFDRQGRLTWTPITGIVKHECREPLMRVVLEGGRTVVVSASHSLFGLRDGRAATIRAAEVHIGDYILAPRILPSGGQRDHLTYTRYAKGSWKAEGISLPLTAMVAEILGWFAAEGSLCRTRRGNHQIQFTLGPHETRIAERLQKAILRVFAARTRVYARPSGVVLMGSDKGLFHFLEAACGTGAKHKRVPAFLFDAPEDIRAAFLDAYFCGDGHYRNQRGEHACWEAKTVSRELALGIHALLLEAGLSPRFSVGQAGSRDFGTHVSQTLPVYSVGYGTSGRGRANAVSFRGAHGPTKMPRRFGDLVLLKVRGLEEIPSTTPYVYDLAVAGHENFVAGAGMVVHNTGEGGAVLTNSGRLRRAVESLRDWGRDCWCEPGKENTCGKRFDHVFESLPYGYDHKYVYSEVGYNLKSTDIQAAIGLAQLERLPLFTAARRANFGWLMDGLADLGDRLILPRATEWADPSWFGFPITLMSGDDREVLLRFLNDRKIGTRNLFGGNLLRQPAYRGMVEAEGWRIVGPMTNSDIVTERSFWIGCWPGISKPMIDFVVETLHDYYKYG